MDTSERIIKLEANVKSNQHRLDEHDTDIKELKKTYSIMEKMDYRMENMEKSVDSINKKLDKHEEKIQEESTKSDKAKGLKWDKLIDYIFYAILAFALFKLGLQ